MPQSKIQNPKSKIEAGLPGAIWIKPFRQAVRRWYGKHARDLAWRRTNDPYAIWVSEIMLQQTTVVAVKPYFERFLGRFGSVHELAAADEADVLRLWEGLGYYSRARNMHRAARAIVQERGGSFPATPAELQQLPGVGRYTAGAIASFAFGARAPILEANTLRLHARLLGFAGDPRSAAGQALLWQFAELVLPRERTGEFNQALMDLGSEVCAPQPQCPACPLRSLCKAFAAGLQTQIPVVAARPVVTEVTEVAAAIRNPEGAYFLARRPEGVRWAGLWDFPRFAWPEQRRWGVTQARSWLGGRVADAHRFSAELAGVLAELRHAVTRYRIRLVCFHGRSTGEIGRSNGESAWIPPEELERYPLSVTGRKLARLLVAHQIPAS